MLFNSLIFIGLVVATMFLYYIPKFKRQQILLLIIASLLFYSWHKPILVTLLLASATINILTSYWIAHKKAGSVKFAAWIGVTSNLGILAFFKYAGLLSMTLFKEGSIGQFLMTIPLPIGISFFTFQGISLVIDVYKEKHFDNNAIIPKSLFEHAKNTLFFISFFPQLVAGPIVKAHEFLPQIKNKRFSDIEWVRCFKDITLGYFLKMVVADNLKDFTFWITFPYFEGKDTISLLTMLFGFSCQIYADFAGYSLIAIGIARLFGYHLMDNFRYPYISSSFREFWKRWHISLSTFLQEYLYIPLGGNRKGKYRTYINLMITMVLGGLWHGAAWSYAVWGTFHGLALAVERLLLHQFKLRETRTIKVLKTIIVFSLVSLAWLLFKLPDFEHVIGYLQAIGKNVGMMADIPFIMSIMAYSSLVVLHHAYYLVKVKYQNRILINRFEFAIYGILLFLILTNSGIPGDFIYFQF